MYYNLLLMKDDSKKPIMKFDLPKEKVAKKVAEFKNGDVFNFDGYQLRADKITRIKIVESELTAEQILEKLNSSIPSGGIMYYTNKDIFENVNLVKDVTDDFLD